MRNILLTVSYDGTDFCGWQRQDKSDGGKPVRTVQAEIEKALFKIHKTKTAVQGSGRTDSGVHAHGQAANFLSPVDSIPVNKYVPALNSYLPHDIRILESVEKDMDFSSRFSAVSRTYRYFIKSQNSDASQTRYVWTVKHEPDLENLNRMAGCLKGENDFAAFTASGDSSLSTKRYVYDARFFIQKDIFGKDLIVFEITANAFLWKMVRSLTGTLIEFDRDKKDLSCFERVLRSCDRKNAGPTAIPDGLFLWKVNFDGKRIHV